MILQSDYLFTQTRYEKKAERENETKYAKCDTVSVLRVDSSRQKKEVRTLFSFLTSLGAYGNVKTFGVVDDLKRVIFRVICKTEKIAAKRREFMA